MIYIINNVIYFDSDKKIIYTRDAKEITLSSTLDRLLLILINNNGVILSRDFLISRILNEHNQVANEKNINSFISNLRRNLSIYTDDEIIITIPKKGIKFQANISINSETHQVNHVTEEVEPYSNKKINLLNIKILSISAIIFALIIFILFYFYWKLDTKKQELPTVGKIQNCEIKFINQYHNFNLNKINLSKLEKSIIENKINCNSNGLIYYYNNNAILDTETKDNGLIFYSYCFYKNNSEYCGSIYDKKD